MPEHLTPRELLGDTGYTEGTGYEGDDFADVDPEYRKTVEAEVAAASAKRGRLKKIAGTGKQTPEERMTMEASMRNFLLADIRSRQIKRDDSSGGVDYRLREIADYIISKQNTNPQSFIGRTPRGIVLTDDDKPLVHRVLTSPEVRIAVGEKIADSLAAKDTFPTSSLENFHRYLNLSPRAIPSRMAELIAKTNGYITQYTFEKLVTRPDFKKWLSLPSTQQSVLHDLPHQYALVAVYMEARKKSGNPDTDPFFDRKEDRDAFFVNAVRSDEGIFHDNLEVLGEIGLLDNADFYRAFLQSAENSNSIAGVTNELDTLQKNHAAARVLTEPAEIRRASIPVLNDLVERHERGSLPADFSQLARSATERYRDFFSAVQKAEDLESTHPDMQYVKKRSPYYPWSEHAEKAMVHYLRAAEASGDPELVRQARQDMGRIFDIVASTRLDPEAEFRTWERRDSDSPPPEETMVEFARTAAKVSGDPAQAERVKSFLAATIGEAKTRAETNTRLFHRNEFVGQVTRLLRVAKYKDTDELNMPGEMPIEMATFFRESKQTQESLRYNRRRFDTWYDNIGRFSSFTEYSRANSFFSKYLGSPGWEKIEDYYFTLRRSNLPHEEAQAKVEDVIKRFETVDPDLMSQEWIASVFDHEHAPSYFSHLYAKYGPERGLEFAEKSAKAGAVAPGIFSDPEAVDFFEKLQRYGLPTEALLYPRFIESVRAGKEQEWAEHMHGIIDNMTHARPLNDNDRASADYLTMVKAVYPESNYSKYEENAKLKDRNQDLKGMKINPDGYPIKMSGAVGYERTQPAVPNLLESYRKRIEGVRDLGRTPDRVFEVIKQMMKRASIPHVIENPQTPEEYGVHLLAIINDHEQRKKNSIPTVFTDAELADLAMAYHMRGWAEEFVRGTADEVTEAQTQDTKDYIQWDALSRTYVEDGKQTLTDLYESLEKTDTGKEHIKKLAERYASDDVVPVGRIAEWLGGSREDLSTTLERVPDPTKHRSIVIKKLKLIGTTLFQNQLKSLSKSEREETITALNAFIEQRMVPEGSDLLAGITATEAAQGLQDIVTSHAWHPLKAVDGTLQSDVTVIKREVGAYRAQLEHDTTKKGKVVEKQRKPRQLKGFFSKSAEVSNARATARICIGTNTKMWENDKYFEFVLFNEDTKECEGTVMLLTMEERGKKYLLYCPNPSEKLISQVSFDDCYKKITKVVTDFARDNDYAGVVASSHVEGRATNRTGGFASTMRKSYLRDEQGKAKALKLNKKYTLGGGYEYGGDEELNYVWKR